jgi:ERCC4-related helicase
MLLYYHLQTEKTGLTIQVAAQPAYLQDRVSKICMNLSITKILITTFIYTRLCKLYVQIVDVYQKNVKVANRPMSVPVVGWNNVAVGMVIVNETILFSSTSLDNV